MVSLPWTQVVEAQKYVPLYQAQRWQCDCKKKRTHRLAIISQALQARTFRNVEMWSNYSKMGLRREKRLVRDASHLNKGFRSNREKDWRWRWKSKRKKSTRQGQSDEASSSYKPDRYIPQRNRNLWIRTETLSDLRTRLLARLRCFTSGNYHAYSCCDSRAWLHHPSFSGSTWQILAKMIFPSEWCPTLHEIWRLPGCGVPDPHALKPQAVRNADAGRST